MDNKNPYEWQKIKQDKNLCCGSSGKHKLMAIIYVVQQVTEFNIIQRSFNR